MDELDEEFLYVEPKDNYEKRKFMNYFVFLLSIVGFSVIIIGIYITQNGIFDYKILFVLLICILVIIFSYNHIFYIRYRQRFRIRNDGFYPFFKLSSKITFVNFNDIKSLRFDRKKNIIEIELNDSHNILKGKTIIIDSTFINETEVNQAYKILNLKYKSSLRK
jgi:hypothetical protein